jgi:exonuclease SbcC
MLTRLKVKNFQTHKEVDLKLDPHCTTFVGPSDKGKSSLLRALRWVATNKPNGSAFIRHGSRQSSATIWVDGHRVTRVKGPGKNLYKLDGLTLKAFGTNPPQDVAKLLNIDDINIQTQHQPLFWFSLSPGQVAKELNQVVDLSIIDKALTHIASQSRSNKAEIAVVEKRLTEAKVKRKALLPVLEAKEALESLLASDKAILETREEVGTLGTILAQANATKSKLRVCVDVVKDGMALVSVGERLKKTGDNVERLSSLLADYLKVEENERQETPDLSKLERLKNRIEASKGVIGKLEEFLSALDTATRQVDVCSQKLKEAEDRMHKEWEGKACPACGQTLPS